MKIEDVTLSFKSILFPAWKVGYLRTGSRGCDSTAILNASGWGGHHHLDSLNLYYYKDGQEVLSDLGYLWDDPDNMMTVRTAAHNLVVVDEANQIGQNRGGSIHLFDVTDHVKVIEASSKAYQQASLYQRTCIVIDHTPENSYLLDIFRVLGGGKHDYLFHGPTESFEVRGLSLVPVEQWSGTYGLTVVKEAIPTEPWHATWNLPEGLQFTATSLPLQPEKVFVGDGWGRRKRVDQWKGSLTIPYLLRRREGAAPLRSVFLGAFEVHREGKPLVKAIKPLKMDPQDEGEVAVRVETSLGNDYVVSALTPKPRVVETEDGSLEINGTLCVLSETGGKLRFLYLAGGTRAEWGDQLLEMVAVPLEGRVKEIMNGEADSYIIIDNPLSKGENLEGKHILLGNRDTFTAYAIKEVAPETGGSRVYVKRNWEGFNVGEYIRGNTGNWKIIGTKCVSC